MSWCDTHVVYEEVTNQKKINVSTSVEHKNFKKQTTSGTNLPQAQPLHTALE